MASDHSFVVFFGKTYIVLQKALIKFPNVDQTVTARALEKGGCPTVAMLSAEFAKLNLSIPFTDENVKIYCCKTNLCNRAAHARYSHVELLLFCASIALGMLYMKL